MKKIAILLSLMVLAVAAFAQPFYGPAFNYPYIGNNVLYPVLPNNFSGTMEVRDGYTYLRTDDNRLFKLNIPKLEGLTIDTVPNTGTSKMYILGYIVPRPKLEIIVVDLVIDGRKIFISPPLFDFNS